MRAVALAVLLVVAAGSASAQPTVFVAPSHAVVQEGDTFELGIRVDAGTDTVTCFLVEFEFDPDIIELASASEGTLFSDCGYSTMFDWDDLGPGHHSCNDVTLGYWAYAICPGELVHLEFHAVAWGETPIEMTIVDLRDLQRDPIPGVEAETGLVTVQPATSVDDDETFAGSLELRPNPFSDAVAMSLAGSAPAGPIDFRVYGPSGRLVADWCCDSPNGGASYWNGTGTDGSSLPGGVYFVAACCGGQEWRGRLVLVR